MSVYDADVFLNVINRAFLRSKIPMTISLKDERENLCAKGNPS